MQPSSSLQRRTAGHYPAIHALVDLLAMQAAMAWTASSVRMLEQAPDEALLHDSEGGAGDQRLAECQA